MKTTIKLESQKPVIIMPLEDYEGMIETIEILSENPNIAKELKKEKKEFLKGNYYLFDKKTQKTHKNTIRTKKKLAL